MTARKPYQLGDGLVPKDVRMDSNHEVTGMVFAPDTFEVETGFEPAWTALQAAT